MRRMKISLSYVQLTIKLYFTMERKHNGHISGNIRILDDDFLQIMVQWYLPIYMWPVLEVTCKQFRRSVALAYRYLRRLDVLEFFKNSMELHKSKCNTEEYFHKCRLFLEKISCYCLSLRHLKGLGHFFPQNSSKLFISQIDLLHLNHLHLTLKNLDLSQCWLNAEGFAMFLGKLINLNGLNLIGCRFDVGPEYLVDNVKDTPKKSSNNFASAEEQLGVAISNLKLEELHLGGMENFVGTFLYSVKTESLKKLSLLSLNFDTNLLCAFVQRCVCLEELNVELSVKFTKDVHGIDVPNFSFFHCLPELQNLKNIQMKISEC